MRSVTFADEKVVDALNASFVLCWVNHGDEELGGGRAAAQPKFTAEELALYPEGGGGGNVRSFFCLPDGRVTHYVEGWFRPERYLGEIEFAAALDEQDLVEKHDRHAKEHRDAQAKLATDNPDEMRKPYDKSAIRREHAMLGLLATVHERAKGWRFQTIDRVIESVKQSGRGRAFK